jgi:ABC-2 type transport system ATP-binding protein
VAVAESPALVAPTARRIDRVAADAAGPLVRVRALTKRFAPRAPIRDIVRFAPRAPAVAVVDRVTLDVMPGEVFGLLGPNGAGKTTIFKMLATMIAPDEGTAHVGVFDIARDPAAVRGVLASVPADERSLNWRLTARENLALFAALQHVPRTEVLDRLAWALATVSLAETGNKRVGEFSSGMRQRLLIARALLTQPKVLLLDEPTRTLDPLSARELRRFLREELVARLGCTILLATHNTDEAFTFCDRVALLHRGRVLANGQAADLAARYGEERYRVLARGDVASAMASLERRGLVERVLPLETTADGWSLHVCTIAGDPSRSAMVLRGIVDRGIDVARLERVETSLADLITRIIGANSEGSAHA